MNKFVPKRVPQNLQIGVFCNGCFFENVCEGSIAPRCFCVYDSANPKYKDCDNCNLFCRERESSRVDLASELPMLHQLQDTNVSDFNFQPVPFIPVLPLDYHLIKSVDKPIVALDLNSVLRLFHNDEEIRLEAQYELKQVNTLASTILLLHGNDKDLEQLWGRNWERWAQELCNQSFRIPLITGPTFSVTLDERQVPAFHNIAMLQRHNAVVHGLSAIGFNVAYNCYYRNHLQFGALIDWIETTGVSVLSLDASSHKNPSSFVYFRNRASLIGKELSVPRHFIIHGVGLKNGLEIKECLTKLGHQVSIISRSPYTAAITGGNGFSNVNGSWIEKQLLEVDRNSLAEANIHLFDYMFSQD